MRNEPTSQPNQTLSRYGNTNGTFLSPAGTPPGARSLPPGTETRPETFYQILKPFDVSGAGQAAPFYGQPGLGLQFDTSPLTIQDHIDAGNLKPIEPNPDGTK